MKTVKIFFMLLVVVLVLALVPSVALAGNIPVVIAPADTMSTVNSKIQTAISNASSGDTITVTGEKSDVASTIFLTIPSGKTVVWKAAYSGAITGGYMIQDGGGSTGGTLEIATGGSLTDTGTFGGIYAPSGFAVVVNGGTVSTGSSTIQANQVVVSGGLVSISGDYSTAIVANNVTVSGGTVSAGTSTSQAISAPTVLVSGGAVTSGTGTAISAQTVTVSGGEVSNSAAGSAYPVIYASGNALVEDTGNIMAKTAQGWALTADGTVTVCGGTVSAVEGRAISAGGANSTVTVSGGAVNGNAGQAIYCSGDITVNGGGVSNNVPAPYSYPVIQGGGNITVQGSAVVRATGAGNGVVIYLDGAKTVTVRGSVTVSTASGTVIFAGNPGSTVAVSGGAAIMNTNTVNGFGIYANGLTTVSENAAVGALAGNAIYTGGDVTVSGGTITATNGKAIWVTGNASCEVDISGGKVLAPGDWGHAIYSDASNNDSFTIRGTAEVSATGENSHAVYTSGAGSVITVNSGTVRATNTGGRAIYANNASSTVTVNGGTVSATSEHAVFALGDVTVTGGEISATTGQAIHPETAGKTVTVSGGTVKATGTGNAIMGSGNVSVSGNAEVSATTGNAINTGGRVTVGGNARISATNGRAVEAHGSGTAVTVTGGTVEAGGSAITTLGGEVAISGGTVSSSSSYTISSGGDVHIAGGMVSAATGYAIGTPGNINVDGGFVLAYGAGLSDVVNTDVLLGSCEITGTGIMTAWDNGAGNISYGGGSATDLWAQPAGAVKWVKKGVDSGISYANGTNTGFFKMAGITVVKAAQAAPAAPGMASKTTTSITLNEISGAEYRLGTGATWQDSPAFTGLSPNTGYTFYARLKETDTHDASPDSPASGTFTTDKAAVAPGPNPGETPDPGETDAPAVVSVKSVSVNKAAVVLKVKKSVKLTAKVLPANANGATVVWTSSAPKTAKVDKNTGRVTALKKGRATITAKTANGVKAKCVVYVNGTAVKKVTLNKTKAELRRSKTLALKVSFSPAKVSHKKVTWKSSDPTKASVSSKGVVKGLKKGTVKITAVSVEGGKKAVCTVTVK